MTVEQLKQIESRHLRRTDASGRRLRRESLEMSVPIDHETTTRLPLVAAETLGIGYGFDRLYFVDLQTGEQRPLPTRYDITKAVASDSAVDNVADNVYRGVRSTGRYTPAGGGIIGNSLFNMDGHGLFHTASRDTTSYNTADTGADPGSWTSMANDVFMTAYAGNGSESGNRPKNNTVYSAMVAPCWTGGIDTQRVPINFDEIFELVNASGDLKGGNDIGALGLIYQYLSPSAWNLVEMNQEVIADFSLAVKDIERTLDAIYNRGRSHYGVRQADASLHKLIISLIELGAAMRTKRYSPNIYSGNFANLGMNSVLDRWEYTINGETSNWTEGVVNDFFWLIDNRYLIAPYWCVNQLNFYDFVDDEREKERRDIDRKDAIETLHLIFQHMETEKGLLHGSDSTLPMLLFDKFKEGVLKDFSDYTSTQAALAAALMGYRTPRDADNNLQSDTVGHVGYYATLPSAHGMLLGSEKAEFLDRISEAGEHAMMTSNPEMFKEGMQLASSFSYQALLGRTRFGEAHTDFQVYPGGWFRGVRVDVPYENVVGMHSSEPRSNEGLQIVWFPLLGWTQFSAACDSKGLLARGLNGAAYTRSLGDIGVHSSSINGHQDLWPYSDESGESYWQPGRDQYSALLLKGTNDLFRTWADRADTISTEGVTVPSFGTVNLVAEMSYDTPHALLTRNFPILRKLYQQAGMSSSITEHDTSFDFMSAGDNMHNVSEWGGNTPWQLVDRALFDPTMHPRDGELDLMPFVYASSSLPESWVDVFQLRDWMAFHTALMSEPIMDAYTRNVTGNTVQNNGYINSRLVVYVDEVQINGDVRDVTCTPIVGSFRLASETRHGLTTGYFDLANERFDRTSGEPVNGASITLYPDNGASTAEAFEYEMFLLNIDRVRSERIVDGNAVPNALHLSSQVGRTSSGRPNDVFLVAETGPLTERDFVPGRGYALRWVNEALSMQNPPVTITDYSRAFSVINDGATVAGLEYLGADIGVLSDGTMPLAPVTDHILTNNGLVHWTDLMGVFIQNAREGLEYSRAQPTFTVFDRDILDITESRFRSVLAPFMMSTVGPLTFVGTMDSSGASQASETITGDSRFEVISLNTGAGASAMDESEPDAEEEAAGDENPSVEVAEKPEVE